MRSFLILVSINIVLVFFLLRFIIIPVIRTKYKNLKGVFHMNDVLEYLQSCGTFYLATSEDGQPHVRPFGAACIFEGKLYFVTNNQKKVYQQLKKNNKVAICGMHNGTWLRIEGEVQEDLRRSARVAMMDANAAALSKMYTVDDQLMTVFYFENGTATLYSFTDEPKVLAL